MTSALILEVGRMAATAPADDKVDPEVVKTGLILVVGILAVVFDTTIVSVALHTLVTQLHSSVSTIQWVSTGYLLALAMTVPLSTWGLRRYGGKRLWMFALSVFLVGSIGSSLAWNADSLIAWRVVQGAGGGLLLSVLTMLIMQAAGGKSLGRTVTLIALPALPALLGPLGPLLGGAILTHLSWRFMFWVNVPFCLIGLVLAAKYLPKDTVATVRPKLDTLGFALLAPGIAALILGLSNAGAAAGFGHGDVIIPLAIGVALLLAFCLHAVRKSEPIANIGLFSHRSVSSSSAVLFFSGFTTAPCSCCRSSTRRRAAPPR
jgi:EmrB/QacA subfamily drug resistance transporter